jgi:hypothetical protein
MRFRRCLSGRQQLSVSAVKLNSLEGLLSQQVSARGPRARRKPMDIFAPGLRVLGKLFRRLFLTRLVALHEAGRLSFVGSIADLTERRAFLRHLSPVRKKRWVAYTNALFAGPEAVLAYVFRYFHWVAISNCRGLLRRD